MQAVFDKHEHGGAATRHIQEVEAPWVTGT
jgi:hypothetical protein